MLLLAFNSTTLLLILCVILFLGLVATAFVIRNLLRKVELYEEDIQIKNEFIEKFKTTIEASDARLRSLDAIQAFESDDEVGYFFKVLKEVFFLLNAYFKNYEEGEEDSKK